MEKKTLLEKAKEINTHPSKIFNNDELMELALAWAKDEIRLKQVVNVLGLDKNPSLAYSKLAMGLRLYVRKIT